MSVTADDTQDRELLITTEKKEKLCNEKEEAKLEIIDNCEASESDEAVIIENGNFETVSNFIVLDKNSSNLKNKNFNIVVELQSSCSFSMTRSIGSSVDDVPIPDTFDIGCSKSYITKDNVSNDKFEKETGRYWRCDENSDVNTYSDYNENLSVGNKKGPIFVKVRLFFGRPIKRFNKKQKVKLHLPYRVKDKNSDLFNFHIFASHYQAIRGMTTKHFPCNFPSLKDFFSKNLPEPHDDDPLLY